MCTCLYLHLSITIIYLSIPLEVSVSVFLSVVLSFNFSLNFLHFLNWLPISWILLSTLSSLSTWRKIGRATYTLFYIWTSSVTTANSQASCISNSSLVNEDRNPPYTSFPELLWEGYCVVATAMLVAVIVETSYLSGTLYPSLYFPQDILFGGFESLHSTILPKGRLRSHMVIWLTQHYRTEFLFKPMSLPWNMHKILIIRWLIKMIWKYTVPLQWQLYLNTDI